MTKKQRTGEKNKYIATNCVRYKSCDMVSEKIERREWLLARVKGVYVLWVLD